MKLFRGLDEFPAALQGGAITIGNFDGVHRGHRVIVDELKRLANEFSGPSVVFTFDPHPVRILRPEQSPPPLTWTDRKADLLAELGIDAVVAYPTDRALLDLSCDDFFQRTVIDRLAAQGMVEGPNFFFGRDRQGDVQRLQQLCDTNGVKLKIVTPTQDHRGLVSSSRVRSLLQAGDVAEARQMLTQPYRIRGIIVHGDARGAALGFPTANLDGIDTLVPAFGVYAGRAAIDSRWHWAAIHIGPSPTFGQQLPRVEVHLLNFDASLYGQTLEVEFYQQLRGIRQFSDRAELITQLQQDIEATRQIARSEGTGA